ncbi:MAG: hypothetical protein LC798_03145 [Chloroflexi bacterium]|nr:hypothetical protein [Chloroflexota bacterium]
MATLLERYQQRLALLRDRAGATVGQEWDDLGSYDEADVPRFLERTTPIVAASQASAATLTDAYVAAETGRAPLGIDPTLVTGAAVRAGVPPEEVYRRPFVQVWKALSEGTDWLEATAAARARVEAVAQTDVQLAMRAAMDNIAGRDGRIAGYRRVLSGKSCAFCAAASTQRYHRQNLLPLHPRCDCAVAPIVGNRDPGRVINQRLLRDLKASGGPQYWKNQGIAVENGQVLKAGQPLEVAVHNHGELGPVLTDASQHFTQL